ncbi:MAG: Lrp/AsnC family transcriptional regulator [Desulfovibrio sp.]|nr:Lrp/AsnC family transcriptional regulator [Desulfovibrio sp.]
MLSLSQNERALLRRLQKNIPRTLTPYADLAKECGMREEEVIEFLNRLKKAGAIRRFGAMIRHQKTDWVHNAMVAWMVDENVRAKCGAIAASIPNISHVYYRPSNDPEWPYTFYTMIHGRTPDEWQETVEKLKSMAPLGKHIVLETVRELKKVSMTYF